METIKELTEIVRIECGSDHSMCIDNYDRLFVFGNNDYGQLGVNDRKNNVSQFNIPFYQKSLIFHLMEITVSLKLYQM